MAATEAQLRVLLQDPAGATEILSTTDYATIISLESNVYRAAAAAARAIAAKYASKVDVKAGPVAVSNSDKYDHYIDLATSFDVRADAGGGYGSDTTPLAPGLTGVSISEMDSVRADTDRVPSAFYRGMMDNDTSLDED